MPAVTIDTFLACSLMLILVLSAMLSIPKIIQAHVDDMQGQKRIEYYQQLVKYLLLSPGAPENWGVETSSLPSAFGLAKSGSSSFYELDIDKVSRLSQNNEYAITYAQLFAMLGIKDVSLKIEFKLLFELSVSVISSEQHVNETDYVFEFHSHRYGQPVVSELSCFVLASNYTQKLDLITSSDGRGTATASISYASNGTAMLVSFAKSVTNPSIISYNVYCFGHNSPTPPPNMTFTGLSPLGYNLTTRLKQADFEMTNAWIFSFNYIFSLNKISEDAQKVVYEIPRLLDTSPIIIVVACANESQSFLEWVSYPQVPLQIGYNPDNLNTSTATFSFIHLVTINKTLYKCIITVGGPASQ